MNDLNVFYFKNLEVHNRLLHFANNNTENIIIFVGGWASTLSTWRHFIPVLKKQASVYYFETREKPNTTYCSKSVGFTIDEMSNDLTKFIEEGIDKKYVLIGASVGASTVINALNNLINKPLAVVLITPNKKIKLPIYFHILRVIPVPLLKYIKPIILFAIQKLSFKSDSHRIEGLINAMSSIMLDVGRKSIIALSKMRLENLDITNFQMPSLVIATKNDSVHNLDDSIAFKKEIQSEITYYNTFTEVHSSKCAEHVVEWCKSKSIFL